MPAGQKIRNLFIATRVGTTKLTSSGPTFTTTETVQASVTFPYEAGLTYKIFFIGNALTSVANATTEQTNYRIREDGISGTQLGFAQVAMPNASGNGYNFAMYAEWAAPGNGSKTIVVTGQRVSAATGTHRIFAGATQPAFLTVDVIPT